MTNVMTNQISLPKDAEGREIPLDTKVLYNEDGKCLKVNHFTYSVVQTMPGLKWGVVFMNCRYDYCSSFYLTPPEPPDSWEKLEEDFDKCIKACDSCRYFSQDGTCSTCAISGNSPGGCDGLVLKDIKERIRKLRGED